MMVDDTKLEQGYQQALDEFNEKASNGASISRYFFWAGAAFGLQFCKDAYSDALIEKPAEEEK